MAMFSCAGVTAGVETLACISSATNYWPGYFFLLLLVGVLYFRLSDQPMRERMVGVLLVTSVISFLGAIRNMLFPDQFFVISSLLFLASMVLLVMRN